MNETHREQIANERFSLIAPLVKFQPEQLGTGERYAILRSIADGKYPGLPLPKGNVGLRTLERYLHLYQEGGIDALKPKARERSSRIPTEYLEAACRLKRENLSCCCQ